MKNKAFVKYLSLASTVLLAGWMSAQADSIVDVSTSTGINQYSVANDGTWTFTSQLISANINQMVYQNGQIYATDNGNNIFKIDAITGQSTTLWTKGTGAWTTGSSGGIAFGSDGDLYFSTAFNGTGSGVYKLATDGTGQSQFIPYTGTGYTLNNSRDLTWNGNSLYVSSRAGYNATGRPIYQFDNTGAFVQSVATNLVGPQSLYVDGTSLLVGSGTGGADVNSIDLTGTLPSNGTLLDHGGGNVSDIMRINGLLYTVNFNSGSGSVGQVLLDNNPANVVVTGGTGVTFNGFVVVPEPGTVALSALGGLVLLGYSRWRKR